MRIEDMIMVSVDDHVIEPPDMFEGRLPAKYQDKAPKLVRRADGTDFWHYDGSEIPNVGLNAVVGRPPEEYGIEPSSLDEMRRGCFDVHERVRDMSANGVLGSMCFPSFPQFCGQLFARREDKDEALAMVRAYNDWHIEGWCGAEPGRFIPLSIPAIWDPELAAAEVRRVAAMGCHAVTFSENPEKLGWPSLHNAHWDPFWTACSDEGTVVCMHLGSSSQLVMTSMEAPIDVMISLQPMNMVQAAADLLWSPVL
ncbi:MAG: amidohydrolase family protein, partial [Acidimicrobiales bacterium]